MSEQAKQEVTVMPMDPLEAELKSNQKAEEADPLDLHAQYFYMYFPQFRHGLETLNKKALIRLISFLVENPLNERDLRTRSKREQDLFQIGDQLLVSKYLMMIITDLRAKEKADKESKKEKEVKGEENGKV